MKRGDVVVFAQKGVTTGKPRPGVIVQASDFLEDATMVVVCGITDRYADPTPFFRIEVEPTDANGLKKPSHIEADRPVPIKCDNIGKVVGEIDDATMAKLNTALALWLGLA